MMIIDFDDTLFDNYRLKRLFIEAVSSCGVPETVYWETYAEIRRDPIYSVYTNERHAALMAKRGYSSEQDVLRALLDANRPEIFAKMLFPDAENFLNSLKALGEPMILLSLGNPEFQKSKISATNMPRWFEKIIIVDESKQSALIDLVRGRGGEKIWFINDRIAQTLELKKDFPNLHCVLKHSVNGTLAEYQASGLPHFETLTEIYEYIVKQSK